MGFLGPVERLPFRPKRKSRQLPSPLMGEGEGGRERERERERESARAGGWLQGERVHQKAERNSSETVRARQLTIIFISLISLSMSSINWMIKSTSLCLYIASVWKFVTRKLML